MISYFNIKNVLNSSKVGFDEILSSGELVMTCPVCDREKHFYFNFIKNRGICQRCKWACNAVSYLMVGLGFSKEDAVRLFYGSTEVSERGLLNRVANLLEPLSEESISNEVVYFKNPIPAEAVKITSKNFPKVFRERSVNRDLVLEYNPYLCLKGRYANRIIFPIKTLGSETFSAITGFSKEIVENLKISYAERGNNFKKSLFPPGSLMSEILFDYGRIKNKSKNVFIVEGLWDFFKLRSLNLGVTCVFGSTISSFQAWLLSNVLAENIYLMLDGDVPIENLKKSHSLLSKICFDKNVFLCRLPLNKDPDDLSVKELKKIILNSKKYVF